jgi:hypothetical protein
VRRSLAAAMLLGVCLSGMPARAAVLSEDELEDESTELGVVAKSFGFVLWGDVLAPPYNIEDANPSSVEIFDLRPYFSMHTEHWRFVLHQPMTSVVRSHASLGLLALGRGATPPRFLPLSEVAADDPTLRLATETDWAYVAYRTGPLSATVGRQPVTLGRGQIFKPWDLVSTFSLTEVDREYKPGVDSLRLDLSPWPKTTLSAIGTAGELESDHDLQATRRGSSLVFHAKQGWERGEVSALGGVIRDDVVVGWGALWDLGSLDLYGETTLSWVRDQSLSSPAVARRSAPVLRALGGATLHPGEHVTLIPELYYEGFGARYARNYLPVALSERVRVGEQLVLGQLYAGAALDWEAHPLVHVTALSLVNTLDPSALVSLATRYDLAANAQLSAGAYVPFGARPDLSLGIIPVPKSEFGLYPYFGFVELKMVL